MDTQNFSIRNIPFKVLHDYREQIFPTCLRTGSAPVLSMENPDHWVTIESLQLFMQWRRTGSKQMKSHCEVVVQDIRAYRSFILPDHLITNSFFTTDNARMWVCSRHLEAFLNSFVGFDSLNIGRTLLASPISDVTLVEKDNDLANDDAISQWSEDSESLAANFTHHELVGFPMSSPMVIRRSTSPTSTSDVFEIYPNVDLLMNIYLGHKYYTKSTFPKFYKSYQSVYAVPSDSDFARKFVRRVPGVTVAPLSTTRTRRIDPEYPEKYKADLLDNEETIKGFMAMAKAASQERKIRHYRW